MNKKTIFISFMGLLCSFAFANADTSAPAAIKEKKIVIIGATSGIGKAVALEYARAGYKLGLAGRREELLKELQAQIPGSCIATLDVTKPNAQKKLSKLIEELGGMDIMIISISAYNEFNSSTPESECNKKTLAVDLLGFYQMASFGFTFFEKQQSGHMVGISSVDGLRGSAGCPVYSGAKAFISKYLEGMRNRYIQHHIPIAVTDIIPGWVDTEHSKFSAMPGTYWVSSTKDAAVQIVDAIKRQAKRAYITKRWALIGWLLHHTPDFIYNAMGGF
ncbi:MAG: Short-chain dehydrogenase/reductase SDR [candidate division TM6 bacterium GW2011_GWE2_42_60]|nr:MAG: Short-chain dehydrogenase/reductase SDR [candidate division TM6 bacterium GW2011_GWE2_42_60]